MLSDHAIANIGQYALIRNKKQQLLVLERIDIKKTGLPGGRLEEGESWDLSLLREVKEESNIDCSNPKPFAVHVSQEDECIKYCVYFTVTPKYPLSVKVDDTKYRLRWIGAKTAEKTTFFNERIKKVAIDFLKT